MAVPMTPASGIEARAARPGVASERLYGLFVEYRPHPFLFVEPGGNYGDELVYRGAATLAALAGLSFKALTHEEFLSHECTPDQAIYIHGGGNFNDIWGHHRAVAQYRRAFAQPAAAVICGPQSVRFEEAALRSVFDTLDVRARRVHLFARERVSFELLRRCAPAWADVRLDHDTALNLAAADLEPGQRRRRYTLYAVRADAEAVPFGSARDSLAMWMDPVLYCRDYGHWLRVHAQAKRIVTNRMHSAVLGALLGIPTTLLPNRYHKNRAVWEYSLEPRGVRWADRPLLDLSARALNAVAPLRRLLEAEPFQERWMRLRGVGRGHPLAVAASRAGSLEAALRGTGRSGQGAG